MKIIICGCGKIGKKILESMTYEHHDVIAIDNNPDVIYNVTNSYDVIGICGNCSSYEKLKEAGVDKAELFISATSSDELNMLSCFVARKMGAKHTVARIRNSEYNNQSLSFIKNQFDLSMVINPEKLTAQAIYNLLKLPSAINVETFTSRKFEIVELVIKDDLKISGASLIELRKNFSDKFLICVLQRENEVYIPNGSTVLKDGDKICMISALEDTHSILKNFGYLQKEARNVMILGASKTAYYLSEILLKGHNSVKIIDKDVDKCVKFSADFEKATVVHGDGMSQDLLQEEGISSVDAFVALTGQDEENILSAFYAKSQNVPKVISKVNGEELSKLSENLGMDCIVTPKNIVADVLVRYARALSQTIGSPVETLYSLMNGNAEALEFIVKDDFEFLNVPIKNLQLKQDVLIAGILRNNVAIIPGGNDVILPGDSVIVIAKGERLMSLGDIIKRR